MIRSLFRWLTGGILDRALSSVDRYVEAQTDREKIKAELIAAHYASRADWMRSGGFWLCLIFAIPLGVWHGMVIYDSAFGCADCILANDWTVAALPAPLDEWAGMIIISIFGVIGVSRLKK